MDFDLDENPFGGRMGKKMGPERANVRSCGAGRANGRLLKQIVKPCGADNKPTVKEKLMRWGRGTTSQ